MTGISHVYVNNVEVGSLPTDQYKTIVKQTKYDLRIYFKQIINIAWVTFGLAIYSIKAVPWVWFVITLFMSMVAPIELAQFIESVRNLSSIDMVFSFKTAFSSIYLVTTLACGISLGISSRFAYLGYKSYFDEAVSLKIRQILEVPTDGHIEVITFTNNQSAPEDKSNEQ